MNDSDMTGKDRIIGQAIQAILRAHRLNVAPTRLAALTRQLLASSREAQSPQVLDVNELVRSMERMLGRVAGESIHLHCLLDPRLDSVNAEPVRLQQALLGLAAHARKAMPEGGKLTIETRNVELGEALGRSHPELPPGHYVMLRATDTGAGMTKESSFMAKEISRGTGLEAVYGIVRQCEGSIDVQHGAGSGTSVRIFLPREDMDEKSRVREAILLVEGDDAVRALSLRALRLSGYIVLEAASAAEALQLAQEFPEPIHLLITDAAVTGSGKLAEQLRTLHPSIRVLYASSYTDDPAIRQSVFREQASFFQKPFSPSALAGKAREVLSQTA